MGQRNTGAGAPSTHDIAAGSRERLAGSVPIMLGERNYTGLTQQQIQSCQLAWTLLCGEVGRPMDCNEAHVHGSRTRFVQGSNSVFLGADAYPGEGTSANARMSLLAALAHELAHAERLAAGYDRPFAPPGNYVDEAETSLRASFYSAISPRDRADLVEDARDRLVDWLSFEGDK
jgi:hypothetical protein